MSINKLFEELTAEEEIKWEQELGAYWAKELAKSAPVIIYLPTAQYGAEGLVGPLSLI